MPVDAIVCCGFVNRMYWRTWRLLVSRQTSTRLILSSSFWLITGGCRWCRRGRCTCSMSWISVDSVLHLVAMDRYIAAASKQLLWRPLFADNLGKLTPDSLTKSYPSVLWHCWLGHMSRKIVSEMTYNVLSGTFNTTIPYHTVPLTKSASHSVTHCRHWWSGCHTLIASILYTALYAFIMHRRFINLHFNLCNSVQFFIVT